MDSVVALAAVCGVLGVTVLIESACLISRALRSTRKSSYTSSSGSKSAQTWSDKVIFSAEDVIWATDCDIPVAGSLTSIDIALQSPKGKDIKPKQATLNAGVEKSSGDKSVYTIISSTLSLDQKMYRNNLAYLHGKRQVYCSFITSSQLSSTNFKKHSSELKELRNLSHENLNQFWGVFSDPYKQGFLYDYGRRGSLRDVLSHSENKIALDWNFKQSLLRDLVNGIRYIHRSSIKYHGNLQSTNCIIDHRWVLKVSGFGLNALTTCIPMNEKPEVWLWTAPEHLRESRIGGSTKGDVYSFGIILQEVITESAPFSMIQLSALEILKKVQKPPPFCRPSVSNGLAPPNYIHLMKECWSEAPERRPTFDEISRKLRAMNKGQKMNIIDNILKKLEKYSSHLEDIVRDRTLALEGEKKKTEQLLSRMLPPSVAEALKSGEPVNPENYDQVTIFFSDIVGFTTISAASTPMQIVNLLNTLYTRFDEIIGYHDVYKVETIGDAYMCASGLPVRNGNKHAGEIATMSLELLSTITEMRVPHLPSVPLKLRIGIHTGHCAAGVVGLTMPRYCLFGDTVNTASRMESHSKACRIHISLETKLLLDKDGAYHTTPRGLTEIKGKGKMLTFWLVGKDGFDKHLPDMTVDDSSEVSHGLESVLSEQELSDLLKAAAESSLQPPELSAPERVAALSTHAPKAELSVTEQRIASNGDGANLVISKDVSRSGEEETAHNHNNNNNNLFTEVITVDELERNSGSSFSLRRKSTIKSNINGRIRRIEVKSPIN